MTLIDEKLLTPGSKKLYVSYYRKRVYADLLADGSIQFKDQVYTSPVPCALHMKRTLNPSLKTDAGWSSMYSTTTGESLKDIKDRLNIRKRGTNVRSAHKEKKAPTPSPTAKERIGQAAIALAKYEAVPKCTACRKEATVDVAECSACHRKTHWKCASLGLEAAPPTPWFCEKCLTGQANRILDFLQQTRRVLVDRIIELKEKKEKANEKEAVTFTERIKEKEQEVNEKEAETFTEPIKAKEQEVNEKEAATFTETIEEDCSSVEDNENLFAEDEHIEDAAAVKVGTPSVVYEMKMEESMTDGASATTDSSSELTAEPFAAYEKKANEAFALRDADDLANREVSTEQKDPRVDALEEKESKQETMGPLTDVIGAKKCETFSVKSKEVTTVDEIIDREQLIVTKTTQTSSAEEKFLVLINSLIAEVSSKNARADVIANTTGAMLVHLEKTQLVQLVESGKREILAATQPEREEDEEQDDEAEDEQDDTASCNNSEVGALIKIFDLRHQILSSQSQFERTTSALAKRTEMHLRDAETKIMELEESRTVETRAMTKVVDLINQYSSDLDKCKQKNYYNEVLLESINHRRSYIRSTNITDRFVPSYRYSTKLMTTSSDQLLLTVLLEKLRDITWSVNEWTKMERHFAEMTSSLNESLSLIGTKRKRTGASVRLPATPALFAKVKIPPSRRLIERQIANYQMNLNSIRQERAQMRKTLFEILKIAREEHLSEEIVRMTDMLYQKCRDLKAEEEEEQMRLKEEAEAEAVAKASAEEDAIRDRQNIDDVEASAEELKAKKHRLNKAYTAFDSNSGLDTYSAAAVATSNATLCSETKGISLLLGSEDLDANESNYNAAETKSQAGNDEDSEEDLEQASRAIADITSSVMPDISGGCGSRVDLLNSSLMTERLGANALRVFTSPGQFMIRGGRGSSDRRDTLPQQSVGQQLNQPVSRPSGQNHQSFLDQALETLNKQQHPQQRPEQPRLEQHRQLGQQQNQLEEHSHQLERQLQLEQQHLLEHQHLESQHHERERQGWDRHERERQERARFERKRLEKQQRLERQHIKKQRQEQERREQQRREQERLEHERYEGQLIEQQHVEEQQRLEEQLREQQRLEQQRLEQQRLEKRQRAEQQRLEHQKKRLEQQRHGEQHQQEQQRKENQRRQQEQQRLELELQCQRQEQERQFQHSKPPSLPQVIPPGSSHLQMLSQQQQQQFQQQQAALQQQQHSRQLQHPLYGDMSKGMLMSSGMGTGQQDVYAQQAAQMGMDMHDIVRHQDSSLFGGSGSGAPRTSFYGDDGHAGQLHQQTVFGLHNLSGQQRQLSDHHMFTNELQQQQLDQPRPSIGNQDFTIGRPYRGLSDNMQHPGMEQSDNNDVNMGDWSQ
ncbi:unnamed protein product [Peronospora farinosa]|uniref:Zinc finger PHD-type domain-containing protein n=1 Tax=Peronospora farinosa TaxID=134698 RepID=A0ABN8BV82_9STRA|nr:unnamed protein product [Peronospora farinosa]